MAWRWYPQSGQVYVAGFMLRTGRMLYHGASGSLVTRRLRVMGECDARTQGG
jgi:hypothetical protein